ncbi:MAG: MoaD/ThiS family protein [Pseudomonadota bacterium]|nr:MoaD/ThiS family protein [Pseudomonadota bacterium]
MKITLKLYASLGAFLPPQAERNAIQIDVPEGATVRQILDSHQVPMETCHLILVNGHFSPPALAHARALSDGDTVAVWPPIAGG